MNWLTVVHGITTQGRHVDSGGCCAEWTTSYTVQYSQDGAHWDTIKDAAGQDKVNTKSSCNYSGISLYNMRMRSLNKQDLVYNVPIKLVTVM